MLIRMIREWPALALPLVLVTACSEELGTEPLQATFGDSSELVAWVEVTPVEFHVGETVRVEVGARNPTRNPVLKGFSSGSCAWHFLVKDSSGSIVASPSQVCTADAPTHEFAPGEIVTKHFSWDGRSWRGSPLPPGEYQVVSYSFDVTPVTIRILAP